MQEQIDEQEADKNLEQYQRQLNELLSGWRCTELRIISTCVFCIPLGRIVLGPLIVVLCWFLTGSSVSDQRCWCHTPELLSQAKFGPFVRSFSNPYHILYLHPTLLAAQSNVAHSLNYWCCTFSFSIVVLPDLSSYHECVGRGEDANANPYISLVLLRFRLSGARQNLVPPKNLTQYKIALTSASNNCFA